MTTEDARARLRTNLESAFGDELRGDLVATMERGFRAQTWRLVGTMFVAFGMFATLVRIT